MTAPIRSPREADSHARSPKPLPGKILIVDDDVSAIAVVQAHLEEAGYFQFKSTVDPTVAFKLIRSTRPDVVILDINMPEVSGIDILKGIRADSFVQRLPVLIMTASANPDVKVVALETGATDFLVKPVDPLELVPRVRNSIESKVYQDQLKRHSIEAEKRFRDRIAELERLVEKLSRG